jgi:hypothetical protein
LKVDNVGSGRQCVYFKAWRKDATTCVVDADGVLAVSRIANRCARLSKAVLAGSAKRNVKCFRLGIGLGLQSAVVVRRKFYVVYLRKWEGLEAVDVKVGVFSTADQWDNR